MHNSASTILAAIDEFGSKKYLMNIGPRKGVLMCNLITELKPNLMIELGGYIGYSAILFGDAIKKNGGQRYISIECNAEYAKVSRQLVELAGLSDVVKIEVGVSDGILRELAASEERAQKIDLLFIDHYKPAYTHDLKLCEELGLVGPGSTVAADNVIHPGAPEYLAYVRRSVEEKRQLAGDGRSEDAATEHPSNKNWYLKGEQKPAETLTTCVMGNSNLIYDSELIMSYEPNGIPVCAAGVPNVRSLLTFRRMVSRSRGVSANSMG